MNHKKNFAFAIAAIVFCIAAFAFQSFVYAELGKETVTQGEDIYQGSRIDNVLHSQKEKPSITGNVTKNTTVSEIINDPAFGDFGRLLFPLGRIGTGGMTRKRMEIWHFWSGKDMSMMGQQAMNIFIMGLDFFGIRNRNFNLPGAEAKYLCHAHKKEN